MRPPSDPAPSAFPERCDYERKYRPDQLREPPGAPDHHGGRFASEGGGGGGSGRRASTPRDQSLGDLAATYESSGRGPGTVSSGKNDPGGVSYGTYQLATNRGRPKEFLKMEGSRWAPEFRSAKPGTPEFSETWRKIAERDPDAFQAAQFDYVKRTHYDAHIALLKGKLSFSAESHTKALREAIWSTAVQEGPKSPSSFEAVKTTQPRPRESAFDFDSRLISRIYRNREMKHPRYAKRFEAEAIDALRLLSREEGHR